MDAAPKHLRRFLFPALLLSLTGLIATAALIEWPASEPAARRHLTLRAAELEGWIAQELLTPRDRFDFAEEGGEPDSAPAWRGLVQACESSAARGLGGSTLPSLYAMDGCGQTLDCALGARRFTPYASMAELLHSDWLRQARLLATLIERSPSTDDEPVTPWLDAAIVFAADLRSSGLLAPGVGAAELEDMVERRLSMLGEPTDAGWLETLRDHAKSALAALPDPRVVAEREARLTQAAVCMFADVPPFNGGRGEGSGDSRGRPTTEATWSIVPAAAAVDELEGYDEHLCDLLRHVGDDRARVDYDRWAATLARQMPQTGSLIATGATLTPLFATPERLERIIRLADDRLAELSVAMNLEH